jgi:type VI secretion system protein ImpM
MSTSPPDASAGLLGKVPAFGDFARISAQDAACQALHLFLESSVDQLAAAGKPAWSGPVFFLHCSQKQKNALLGVLGPSRDKVGRAFPLSIFRLLPAQTALRYFPALPDGASEFFSGAVQLLADAATLSAQDLTERLQKLPGMGPLDFAGLEAQLQRMLAQPRPNGLPSATPDDAYYAFRTFMMACQSEKEMPATSGIIVDCPLEGEVRPAFWLTLCRKLLSWKEGPPSLFWTQGPGARLLLSLGPPTGAALVYLAKPQLAAARLWPLRTTAAAALSQARSALPATQKEAILDSTLSCDALFASLAG